MKSSIIICMMLFVFSLSAQKLELHTFVGVSVTHATMVQERVDIPSIPKAAVDYGSQVLLQRSITKPVFETPMIEEKIGGVRTPISVGVSLNYEEYFTLEAFVHTSMFGGYLPTSIGYKGRCLIAPGAIVAIIRNQEAEGILRVLERHMVIGASYGADFGTRPIYDLSFSKSTFTQFIAGFMYVGKGKTDWRAFAGVNLGKFSYPEFTIIKCL